VLMVAFAGGLAGAGAPANKSNELEQRADQ
jgi:hypothetical protein